MDDSASQPLVAVTPRSLLRRGIGYLFGYNFFISYRWADGSKYALALESALRREGRKCFLDRSELRLGNRWSRAAQQALDNTRVLILVGTEGAFESDPVLQEVTYFADKRRPIFPIDIGGALAAAADSERLLVKIGGRTALTVIPLPPAA